jgi:hypothetical protein
MEKDYKNDEIGMNVALGAEEKVIIMRKSKWPKTVEERKKTVDGDEMKEMLALRSFVDIQITDRQNIDIQIVDTKSAHLLLTLP